MGPLQGKIQAAFQCPYPYLIMVQSPSTTRLTLLNLVQQIGRSNVAASVVFEVASQGSYSRALLHHCHKNTA